MHFITIADKLIFCLRSINNAGLLKRFLLLYKNYNLNLSDISASLDWIKTSGKKKKKFCEPSSEKLKLQKVTSGIIAEKSLLHKNQRI